MSDDFEIRYCKWGLAERTGDVIYLNENLKRPEWEFLRDHLLEHELKHESEGAVTFHDLKHDLKDATRAWLPFEVQFMMKYPKSMTQLLAVSIRNKQLCIDWTNLIVNIGVIGIIIVSTWFVLGWLK